MAKEKQYTWYVMPGDAHTNEVVARYVDAENFSNKLSVSGFDGPRSAWKCDHAIITALEKSKRNFNLNFVVLIQENRGPIRLWSTPVHVHRAVSVTKTPK